MNMTEKSTTSFDPTLNWKKIGEVLSNERLQCLIICTICVENGIKFDRSYHTNDASAFWHHVQTQHADCPILDDVSKERNSEVCDGINNSGLEVEYAESAKLLSRENNADDTQFSGGKSPSFRNEVEENNCITDNTVVPRLKVVEAQLPKTNSNTHFSVVFNEVKNQIVDISDDEDCTQNEPNKITQDSSIELSDDEDIQQCDAVEQAFGLRSITVYTCDVCGELFLDADTLKRHRKAHTNGTLKSKVSQSVSKSLTKKSHSACQYLAPDSFCNGQYRCRFCRYQFASIHILNEHQKNHFYNMSDEEQILFLPLDCRTCGEYFYSIDILMTHEKIVHQLGVNLELTKCYHCQKIVSKFDLESHIYTGHNEETYSVLPISVTKRFPFKCGICGRRTITAASMAAHHQRFHSTTDDPKVAHCEFCNRVLLSRNLPKHIKSVHRNSSKMKCPHCNQYFKSKSYLLLHMAQLHPTLQLHDNQIPEEILSFNSTTTQSELMNNDGAEHFNSWYTTSFADLLNDQDDIISYGELIPINLTGTNSSQ